MAQGIPLELEENETVGEQVSEESIPNLPDQELDDAVENLETETKKRARVPIMPPASSGGAPSWAKIPRGMKFPRNAQVAFMLFRASWTQTPQLGDRQIITWPISVGDKKLALGRCMGDSNRVLEELAKAMIRAIDGQAVSWDGTTAGNVDVFWNQAGEKVRALIVRIYLQLHTLDEKETRDFFENCIAVRSTG